MTTQLQEQLEPTLRKEDVFENYLRSGQPEQLEGWIQFPQQLDAAIPYPLASTTTVIAVKPFLSLGIVYI